MRQVQAHKLKPRARARPKTKTKRVLLETWRRIPLLEALLRKNWLQDQEQDPTSTKPQILILSLVPVRP